MARRRSQEDVELNVAAMLDMAFQLLTFFILTFKPAPVEGDIMIHMPPPQSVVALPGKAPGSEKSNDPLKGLTTLVITAVGLPSGQIEWLAIGTEKNQTQLDEPKLGLLNTEIKKILADPNNPFDQVIIQVGSDLNYNNLMMIVAMCTQYEKLQKLSFVELPASLTDAKKAAH